MAFQEGDLVQLKSGGPRMTVEGYEDGLVVCVWFEGNNRKSNVFKEATLKMWVQPGPSFVVRG